MLLLQNIFGVLQMKKWLCCLLACGLASLAFADLPLYYWDARQTQGFSNFGDALSEQIISRILERPLRVTPDPYISEQKLVGIGSIINYAQEGDVLWGCGINFKYRNPSSYRFQNVDVRAVRGPLTREFLLKMGVGCPEIYGDPTLLLPKLFPEFKKAEQPAFDYIVIPHFSDEHAYLNDLHLVSVKEGWDVVVQKILNSKFVISSALSGVIVAEAYGIPARMLRVSENEDLLKYADYYQGTNRKEFKYAKSVQEALEMGGEPMPECDLDKLLQSFPYEYFN